jgi:hypothetical protein
MRLLNACSLVCMFVSTMVAADNAFIGTWKLNTEKSKFSPGSEIKSMTITFAADGDKVRRTAEGTDVEGKPIIQGGPEGSSIPWDGKDHYITKAPAPMVTVAVKQLDSHSLTAVVKTDGKISEQIKSVVSVDGKTFTSEDKGTTDKGLKFHSVEVFDKQ